MTTPSTSEPSAFEDSIRIVLGGDHQRLEESFEAIVQQASCCEEPADLRGPWQMFERQLLAHFDAEETHVLPVFGRSRPKEAREILEDHARIRGRLVELAIDLDLHCLDPERVRTFVEELRAHAAREELLLHSWATRQLGTMEEVRSQKMAEAMRPMHEAMNSEK